MKRAIVGIALSTAALLFGGCHKPLDPQSESEAKPGAASAEQSSLTMGPLNFRPESGLDLITAASRVERAMHFGLGKKPPVLVLELLPGHDTTGKFSLSGQYSSLSALAAAMETQDTAYAWEVVDSKHLVIKPKSSAMMDTTVTDFTVTDMVPCDVFQQLNLLVHPTRPGKGGCLTREPPKYRSSRSAFDLGTQTISLLMSGTHTIQDVYFTLLNKMSANVGLNLFEIDTRMHAAWELRW